MRTDIEVLPEDERPARRDGKCFYCTEPIGGRHQDTCSVLSKTVMARFTVTIPVEVHLDNDKEHWEFWWNEGTHCGDNVVDEIDRVRRWLSAQGMCLCDAGLRMVPQETGDPNSQAWTGEPWSVGDKGVRIEVEAEWVHEVEGPPHRRPEIPEDDPDEIVSAALSEIANRRCREGNDRVCATKHPDERHRWCEPCVAHDAFERSDAAE